VFLTGFAIAGQRWLIAPLVAIVAVLAAIRQRRIRPVVVAAATLGALWVGAAILKTWTGRVAPASGVDAVHAGGSSYPSGHAAGAMVGYGLITALSGSGRLRGWAPWQVSTLAGGVVGVVVILLDYHWVTDTLGAWLLSALVLQIPAMGLSGTDPLNPPRDRRSLRRPVLSRIDGR
jgi:undecaprenyl-diphosphatase